MKTRIEMIAQFSRKSYQWSALAVILMAGLALVGFTTGQETYKSEPVSAQYPEQSEFKMSGSQTRIPELKMVILKEIYADLLADMKISKEKEKQFIELLDSRAVVRQPPQSTTIVLPPNTELEEKLRKRREVLLSKKVGEVITNENELKILGDVDNELSRIGIGNFTNDTAELNAEDKAELIATAKKTQGPFYKKMKVLLGNINYEKFCSYEQASLEASSISACLNAAKLPVNPAQYKSLEKTLRETRHWSDLAVCPAPASDAKIRKEEDSQILSKCDKFLSLQQEAILERVLSGDPSVTEALNHPWRSRKEVTVCAHNETEIITNSVLKKIFRAKKNVVRPNDSVVVPANAVVQEVTKSELATAQKSDSVTEITADSLTFNNDKKTIKADGNVKIAKDAMTATSQKATYNAKNGKITLEEKPLVKMANTPEQQAVKSESAGGLFRTITMKERNDRVNCLSDLNGIYGCYKDLQRSQGTSDLHGLVMKMDPKMFVGSGSGHKPGKTSEMDQWADYVFVTNKAVTNLNENDVLIFSKPECYPGKGGNVVFVNGSGKWCDLDEYNRLTKGLISSSP